MSSCLLFKKKKTRKKYLNTEYPILNTATGNFSTFDVDSNVYNMLSETGMGRSHKRQMIDGENYRGLNILSHEADHCALSGSLFALSTLKIGRGQDMFIS